MDVVPSELITGRWKLNSSVCTIMCFGHIDSAAVCFNDGCSIFPHCHVSLIPLSQKASNVTNVHWFLCFSSGRTQTAGFQETLTDVEILALIVGCVCHDLDHRGTNNAFQAK